MKKIDLRNLEQKEIFPGYKGRLIHSEHMTFVYWTVDAGSAVPAHSHPHEQVVNLLDGEFQLTVDGETEVLKSLCVVIIPPYAKHSGRALTDCSLIDVFYPVREDYRYPA